MYKIPATAFGGAPSVGGAFAGMTLKIAEMTLYQLEIAENESHFFERRIVFAPVGVDLYE